MRNLSIGKLRGLQQLADNKGILTVCAKVSCPSCLGYLYSLAAPLA